MLDAISRVRVGRGERWDRCGIARNNWRFEALADPAVQNRPVLLTGDEHTRSRGHKRRALEGQAAARDRSVMAR